MRLPTREQQKALVRQWEKTGVELERLRKQALKGKPYDWTEVDALLEIGDLGNFPHRTSSGLVEMQHQFMKAHRQSLPK